MHGQTHIKFLPIGYEFHKSRHDESYTLLGA